MQPLLIIIVAVAVLVLIYLATKPAQSNEIKEKIMSMINNKSTLHHSQSATLPRSKSPSQSQSRPKSQSQSQSRSQSQSDKKLTDNFHHLIYDQFLEPDYRFNLVNLPVTTRTGDNLRKADTKYLKHIRTNIKNWSPNIKNVHIVPLFVKETGDEYFVISNIHLTYYGASNYFRASFYCRITRSDDIINNEGDTYEIQLVEYTPITRNDYYIDREKQSNISGEPFITLEQANEIVDHVNQMHADEMSIEY